MLYTPVGLSEEEAKYDPLLPHSILLAIQFPVSPPMPLASVMGERLAYPGGFGMAFRHITGVIEADAFIDDDLCHILTQ